MKKLIALLLALAMVLSLSACSGDTAQSDPTETTEPLYATPDTTEPPAAEPADEAMPAEEEPAAEAVDYTGFIEESMDDVRYQVPESWRKEDYSNEFIKEYVYYLDESNENSVMVMMLYPENVLYTWQQAEDYMDLFASSFFSEQNGYTAEGEFSTHEANVPARHGYCTSNGCEIEVYCFMPTVESVFILSNWHVADSSSEIDDDTFLKIVNSVQLPELKVTGKPEKDTGSFSSSSSSSSSSGFTNKFGTANTTCAVSGCNRSIASSGDTNCCSQHSKKCGNCGCYIDSDAMFCMSCISSSLDGSSSSSKKSSSSSSSSSSSKSGSDSDYDYDKGFGYSAPKPGQSFSDYVKEQDPELYNSLFR